MGMPAVHPVGGRRKRAVAVVFTCRVSRPCALTRVIIVMGRWRRMPVARNPFPVVTTAAVVIVNRRSRARNFVVRVGTLATATATASVVVLTPFGCHITPCRVRYPLVYAFVVRCTMFVVDMGT